MSNHNHILYFIRLIRGQEIPQDLLDQGLVEDDSSAPIIQEVFTKGNCGNFAEALRVAFGGEVMEVEGARHVVCKIGDRLYDITGDVTTQYPHYQPAAASEYMDNYSFAERGPIV